MNELSEVLKALKARCEGAFMPFLVVGDPDFERSRAIVDAIAPHTDIFEFGIPFSDPPADGPVIQAADLRALRAGVTVKRALEFLGAVRIAHKKPIALLLYYNLVLNYGVDAFYRDAKNAGVDAILVADLPLEESAPASYAAAASGIHSIYIVSELSTDARIRETCAAGSGYLYLVARIGTTGERADVSNGFAPVIERVRAQSDMPVMVGFGLSDPVHVTTVMEAGAAGAIVGSALVRRIGTHAHDTPMMLKEVEALAARLKAATRRS